MQRIAYKHFVETMTKTMSDCIVGAYAYWLPVYDSFTLLTQWLYAVPLNCQCCLSIAYELFDWMWYNGFEPYREQPNE